VPVAVVILALAVAGLVVGGATVVGAPIFALPILVVLLAGAAAYAIGRRVLRRTPQDGGRERIEFDERDRKTLVPSPTPEERQRNRRRAARTLQR
jgi:membrane protein implicated in regulation of membrane protease activity